MKHIEWSAGKYFWLFDWMRVIVGINIFTKYNKWFRFSPQFSWQYPNDRLKRRYFWREQWEFSLDIEVLKIGFELMLLRWYKYYHQCGVCDKYYEQWDEKSANECCEDKQLKQ